MTRITCLVLFAAFSDSAVAGSSVWLPDAVAVDTGAGEVFVSSTLGVDEVGLYHAGQLGGTVCVTDELAVDVQAILVNAQGVDLGAGTFAARYNLVQTDAFRLGPWVGAVIAGYGQAEVGGFIGLAVEGGSERLRADASIPLWGVTDVSEEGAVRSTEVYAPLVSEAGLSFYPAPEHRIRVAAVSLLPYLGYQYRAPDGFTVGGEVGVLPVGLTSGGQVPLLGRVNIGYAF